MEKQDEQKKEKTERRKRKKCEKNIWRKLKWNINTLDQNLHPVARVNFRRRKLLQPLFFIIKLRKITIKFQNKGCINSNQTRYNFFPIYASSVSGTYCFPPSFFPDVFALLQLTLDGMTRQYSLGLLPSHHIIKRLVNGKSQLLTSNNDARNKRNKPEKFICTGGAWNQNLLGRLELCRNKEVPWLSSFFGFCRIKMHLFRKSILISRASST